MGSRGGAEQEGGEPSGRFRMIRDEHAGVGRDCDCDCDCGSGSGVVGATGKSPVEPLPLVAWWVAGARRGRSPPYARPHARTLARRRVGGQAGSDERGVVGSPVVGTPMAEATDWPSGPSPSILEVCGPLFSRFGHDLHQNERGAANVQTKASICDCADARRLFLASTGSSASNYRQGHVS